LRPAPSPAPERAVTLATLDGKVLALTDTEAQMKRLFQRLQAFLQPSSEGEPLDCPAARSLLWCFPAIVGGEAFRESSFSDNW